MADPRRSTLRCVAVVVGRLRRGAGGGFLVLLGVLVCGSLSMCTTVMMLALIDPRRPVMTVAGGDPLHVAPGSMTMMHPSWLDAAAVTCTEITLSTFPRLISPAHTRLTSLTNLPLSLYRPGPSRGGGGKFSRTPRHSGGPAVAQKY